MTNYKKLIFFNFLIYNSPRSKLYKSNVSVTKGTTHSVSQRVESFLQDEIAPTKISTKNKYKNGVTTFTRFQ